jgi:hypothetical protein
VNADGLVGSGKYSGRLEISLNLSGTRTLGTNVECEVVKDINHHIDALAAAATASRPNSILIHTITLYTLAERAGPQNPQTHTGQSQFPNASLSAIPIDRCGNTCRPSPY